LQRRDSCVELVLKILKLYLLPATKHLLDQRLLIRLQILLVLGNAVEYKVLRRREAQEPYFLNLLHMDHIAACQVNKRCDDVLHVGLLVEQRADHAGAQIGGWFREILRHRPDLRVAPTCHPEHIHTKEPTAKQQNGSHPQPQVQHGPYGIVPRLLTFVCSLPGGLLRGDEAVWEAHANLELLVGADVLGVVGNRRQIVGDLVDEPIG